MHRVAALLLLALLPALLVAQQPVAVVVDAGAAVRVRRLAGDTVPASAGLRLHSGEEVIVPPGARATVLFRSGQMERVATRLVIGASAATGTRPAAVALGERHVAPAPGGRIRPLAGAPVQLSPRNSVLPAGVLPTFTWFAVPGVRSYRVQWRQAGARTFTRVEVRDTVLAPPYDASPFAPGTTYEWAVIPSDSGRVATPVQFRIMSAAEQAGWVAELRRIDALQLEEPGAQLLRFFAHVDAGLYYEALDAWARWQRAGLAASPELQALAESVRAAVGLPAADRLVR